MIKSIAIVGRGLPLLTTVAFLQRQLKPHGIEFKVIQTESSTQPSQSVVCGGEFSPLCELLGLNETDVVRQAQGTFRLGTAFLQEQHHWFVPFGHIGLTANQDDFEQAVFQFAQQNHVESLDVWTPAAQAARSGKFAVAPTQRPDMRQMFDYGVHLHARSYGLLLEQVIDQSRVTRWQCQSNDLIVQTDQKRVKSVQVGNETIEADLWIDCSGDRALLMSQVSVESRERIDLRFSGRVSFCLPQGLTSQPYTLLQKTEWGWLKRIPLREVIVMEAFYDPNCLALAELTEQLSEQFHVAPVAMHCHDDDAGHFAEVWQGNCLALGHAANNPGCLFYAELNLLQAALVQFVDMFPISAEADANQRCFNQLWRQYVHELEDYLQLIESDYQPDVATVSAGLRWRIELFSRLGRLEPLQTDATTEAQWYALLFGKGFRPTRNSVVTESMSYEQLANALSKVQARIQQIVQGMPAQTNYLNQFYS